MKVSHAVAAAWSRAALVIRLSPPQNAENVLWWTRSLSIDEARALIRELSRAVEVGQGHLAELKGDKTCIRG